MSEVESVVKRDPLIMSLLDTPSVRVSSSVQQLLYPHHQSGKEPSSLIRDLDETAKAANHSYGEYESINFLRYRF